MLDSYKNTVMRRRKIIQFTVQNYLRMLSMFTRWKRIPIPVKTLPVRTFDVIDDIAENRDF